MTCPNCGKEVNDGVKFCGGCGTTLDVQPAPVETPVEQPVEAPVAPVEVPVEAPVEQPVVQPVEQPVEVPVEQPVQQPVQPMGQTVQPMMQPAAPKEKNKLFMIIPIAVAALVVLGLIIFVGSKLLNKGNSKLKEDPTYSTSFFLKDKDSKYALFNEDGKNLTGFAYKKVGEFINGYALVVNDKDEYGIIKTNGKMSVAFGKYPLIMDYNGLYVVPNADEEFKYTLITGSGKKVTKMKQLEISTLAYDTDSIISVELDQTYEIYNFKGKKIATFKKTGNKDDKIKTNDDEGFGTVYYNGETVVYNVNTGDYITTIKEKDTHYCVNDASEDGKILTFNSCVGLFEKQDETKYKVVVNKKEVKIDEACKKPYLTANVLACETEKSERYFLTSKYKLGAKFNSSYTAIIDKDTYLTKEDDGYSFYKGGKLVKHITGVSSVVTGLTKDYYAVKSSDDYLYYYYDKEGNKAISKGFKISHAFDDNGLAIVGDDYYTYYIIDKKGNKVGETYYSVSRLSDTDKYIVSKKDGSTRTYGIIDTKGKLVMDLKYESIDYRKAYENVLVIAKKEDKSYDMIALKNMKQLSSHSEKPSVTNQYYYVTNGDKVEYYTLKGKKFYER